MTPQSTKVRLVRCPNCRQVLPELPNISLYRCGGCNTILQAKNRKMETNPAELTSESTDSTSETPQNYDSQEETRSSNPVNDPPPKGSSPDKENITCRDENVGSSSELFMLRSISTELSFSAEANRRENEDLPMEESLNHDKDIRGFGQYSERGCSEIHDSDGDSIGCCNFSGDFPSSSELSYNKTIELTPEDSKFVEEVVIVSLNQPTKAEQQNGEGSFSNFLQDVRDFSMYEGQDNGSPLVRKHVPLDIDCFSEEFATSSNHDLTSLRNKELLLDMDNIGYEDENVKCTTELLGDSGASGDLSSLPEVNSSEKEYPPVEESSNHDNFNLSVDQNSARCDERHDSDEEFTGVQTSICELPSSNDLVYNETEEFTTKDSECVEDVENALDQPIEAVKSDGGNILHKARSLPEQEDLLPPVDSQHAELMKSNYICLDGVSESRATTLNYDTKEELSIEKCGKIDGTENYHPEASAVTSNSELICSPKEELPLEDDGKIHQDENYHPEAPASISNYDLISPVKEGLSSDDDGKVHQDEKLECSMEVFEDKSIYSNGLSDSCGVFFENGYSIVEESLNDGRKNCSSGQQNNPDAESSEIRNLSLSETVYQKTEELNTGAREHVQEDVKVSLDKPTKVDQTNYGKSLGILTAYENVLHDVGNISEHENQENELSPKVTDHRPEHTYVYVENDDVAEQESEVSDYDLSTPPKGESLLDKSKVEAITKLSEDESVSDNPFGSYETKCGGNEDSLGETLNPSEGRYVLGQDSEKYDTGLQDLDEASTEDRFCAELPPLVYHKINELRLDTNTSVECFDQSAKIEESEGEKSLEIFQESDKFVHEVSDSSDHEELNNRLSPVDGEQRGGSEKIEESEGEKSLEIFQESDKFVHEVSDCSDHEELNNRLSPVDVEQRGGSEKIEESEGEKSLETSQESDKFVHEVSNCSVHEELKNRLSPVDGEQRGELEKIEESEGEKSLENFQESDNFVHEVTNCSDHEELKNRLSPVDGKQRGGSEKIEESEGERSLEIFQESDKFMHEVSNCSDHEELKNRLSPVDGDQRGGSENNFGNLGNDKLLPEVSNCSDHEDLKNIFPPVDGEHRGESENDSTNLEICVTSEDQCANQNEGFCEEMILAGVASSFETVPHQNSNESQYSEPSVVNQALAASPTTTLNSEKYVNPSDGDTNDASQSALTGRAVSANFTSADEDYKDQSRRRVNQNFESASSAEFWGSSLIADTSHHLSNKRGDPNDSSISMGRYAYDGSESSDDGTDNQIPSNVLLPYRRKAKYSDNVSTMPTLKRNEIKDKNMVNFESGVNLKPPRPHAVRGSHWKPNEFTDTRRYVHGNEHMMTLREGAASQLPFLSRDLPAKHKRQSPSIYGHFLSPSHSHYDSSDKTSYPEHEKVKLLRTVCELEDQLNRIQLPKISKSGGFQSRGKGEISAPLYFDHLTSDRERYGESNHLECYSRYNQERGWADQSNVSRLALSEEAASYRHQVNCSCSHCRAKNWRYSAPLPPQSSRYKSNLIVSQTGYNHLNVSSSSSPKHYKTSEFSGRGSDAELDRQMYRDNELRRLYLMDKYHTSKKLLRPMAGGSPFVSCYHCSEILQLPADFLLFKKRYHKLRCIACSKVLKFMLVEGMHIVPYLSDRNLPLRETGNFSDASNQRNLVLMPQFSSWPNGEPVSCSDDYGRSLHRIYSTEGEDSAMIPSSGIIERNRYNRNSSEATKERKMKSILKESVQNNKVSVRTFEPGASSGLPKFINVPSEIEELPQTSNSPLHQLMGYASPSEVIYK